MSKIMIAPSSIQMIEKAIPFVDSYLLSVQPYSVNAPFYLKEEELEQVIKTIQKNGKEIFLNLNKNMFENDLKPLEEFLEKVESYHINGIFFYDVSIPSIKRRKHYQTPLVWAQEHFTTNYLTMNYWLENGVDYALVSTEITKEEVDTIMQKTKMQLILPVFGYVPFFHSKRPLVSNYQKTFSIPDKSNVYYMEKEGKHYPIKEEENGLVSYHAEILNAYPVAEERHPAYLFFNSFQIEEDAFLQVLSCYQNHEKERLFTLFEENNLFYDQKTVYRVKDL